MPPCSRCHAPAVTFLRYSGQHLCREHFVQFFERRAKAELAAQGRLPKGITAVALSGGKDSVALLHFLAKLARDRPDCELVAITVDEGIAGYRDTSLPICESVTRERGVPWHVVTVKELAGYDIDAYASGRAGPSGADAPHGGQGPADLGLAAASAAPKPRPACGPCGVFRRLGMNRLAREVGAAAIATGHNLDDAAQTVLMNVLKGDLERLSRLAPHTDPKQGLVPRIQPFRTIPEKEVLLYALLEGLPLHHEEECPYAVRAQRFFLRDKLLELEERSPGTRHALVRMQDKLKPILLANLELGDVSACPTCGEPTSGATCKPCALRAP